MSNNFFLADRIKELSRVEGRGNISLDGAADGFSSFGDFYASGDTVFYAITDNVKYEVGSGVYVPDGATGRSVTRHPIRSSDINSGPYFLYGSGAGSHAGKEGYFYPMWLTRSAALSGVGINGASKGPYTNVHEHVFSGVPGTTFFMPSDHMVHGVNTNAAKTTAATSGSDYASASRPVDFDAGTKEVFITYPGARAVYNAYGIDPDVTEPKESGLAIWKNNQILSYSSNLVWNDSGNFLGIRKNDPSFAIDIGGLKSFSQVRASGFMDGGSGVLFSGVAGSWSGGRQLEPFLRNRIANTANGVVKLSGLVDEFIGFENQQPSLVFAGPGADCGCDDATPTFRALVASDFPLVGDDGLDNRYVKQNNDGIVGGNDYPFNIGQVALYKSSGQITYDSGILYDATNDRLGLGGGNVGIIDPAYTLDVSGNMAANSGHFDQLIFTDNLIRIGENSDPLRAKGHDNSQSIFIGYNAGSSASGFLESAAIGHSAGLIAKDPDYSVMIGNSAGRGSNSGQYSAFLGYFAGQYSDRTFNSTFIGNSAGSGSKLASNFYAIGSNVAVDSIEVKQSVALGDQAMSGIARSSGIVALGYKSLSGTSGIVRTVSAGFRATRGVNTGNDIVSIGTDNLEDASDIDNVISIGKEALIRSSGGLEEVTAIGFQAGYQSVRVKDSTFLGRSAGQTSSGTFNIYVGHNAGIAVSGHENIEIIASGGNSSILTHSSVGKINIGNTIVGDVNAGSVGVGHMTNATPPATLFVQTSGANDHAMIIRQQGSGSRAPYFALQSGDATTFFQITNSGNVMTSGWLSASGGLHLGDRDPTRASGDGGYMLWNNAGTLVWNGRNVDTAGGTTFKVSPYTTSASSPKAVSISDGQLVTISGVSGVEVQQNADRFLRISASGLSGVLQDQIDALSASNYNFFATSYGPGANEITVDGAGKYDFTRNQLSTIADEGVIALSGVSGIKIDFTHLTGNGLSSGIYTIGYDSNVTFTANLIASGEVAGGGRNKSRQLLLNGSGLAFSGVKGVDFSFSQGTNPQASIFTLDPSTLSGVLFETTMSSGRFLKNQIDLLGMAPGSSGALISGVAFANHLAIQGITSKSATSGIAISNDKYVMDSGNGGQLSFLRLTDINYDAGSSALSAGSGTILITDQSGVLEVPRRGRTKNSVYIGSSVGQAASGYEESVMIGNRAGKNARVNTTTHGQSVFIGNRAGEAMDQLGGDIRGYRAISPSILGHNIGIGAQALRNSSGVQQSIAIGKQAGENGEYIKESIAIGENAHQNARNIDDVISIGDYTGHGIHSSNHVTNIGTTAGRLGFDIRASQFLGYFTGEGASGVSHSVGLGNSALQDASGHFGISYSDLTSVGLSAQSSYDIHNMGLTSTYSHMVAIGSSAGRESYNNINSVFVGRDAGLQSSGVTNSIFLGNNAGQVSSHANSIILSNKALGLDDDDLFPIVWTDHDHNFILDIGHGIQGKLKAGPASFDENVGRGDRTQATDVRLHIGPRVGSSTHSPDKLEDKTLEIQPSDKTHTVLVLDQPNDKRFHKTRDRLDAPMLSTVTDFTLSYMQTTDIAGTNGLPMYGDGTRGNTLPIINQHGMMVMPIAYKFVAGELITSSAPNADNSYVDDTTGESTGSTVNSTNYSLTNFVPKYPGAFALFYDHQNAIHATFQKWYMAVCLRMPDNDPTAPTELVWNFIEFDKAGYDTLTPSIA